MFILPESVTNVKKHTKLRKWLLDNVNLSKINSFGSNFSGTIFPIISMIVDNTSTSNTLIYDNKLVNKQLYYTLPFYYFRPISEEDQKSTLLILLSSKDNSSILLLKSKRPPYIINIFQKFIIFFNHFFFIHHIHLLN